MSKVKIRILKVVILIYLFGFIILSIFVVPMENKVTIIDGDDLHTINSLISYNCIYSLGEARKNSSGNFEITRLIIDMNRLKIQLLAWTILCGGLGLVLVMPSSNRMSDTDIKSSRPDTD